MADPVTVVLAIVPQFPLLSLACCTEGFRLANRQAGRKVFDWHIATGDGAPVQSSSGIRIAPSLALGDIQQADVAIVLSAYGAASAATAPILRWLRRMDRRGALIASVDTSVILLAKAGLIGDEPLCVHQEAIPAVTELLGERLAADRWFTLGRRRASSAGGAGTLDLVLAMIGRFQGPTLAARVAHILNFRRNREGIIDPAADRDGALYRIDPRLARMVEAMLAHMETPLPATELARRSGVPAATAQRLFRRHTGRSLAGYYVRLRLDHAQSLLADTHLSVTEIARCCGFASGASLARAYRRRFSRAPSALRHTANQVRMG